MKNLFLLFFLILTTFSISQTLYPYKQGDKWGYSDINGEVVIKPKYDLVGEQPFSKFSFVKKKDKYVFIDTKGKQASKIKYDKINYSGGRTFNARIKGKPSLCLDKNLIKIDCIYRCGFNGCCEQYFNLYKEKGKIGVKEIDYKVGIRPLKITQPIWDKFQENSNGLAKVKSNGFWGVINKKVEYLIPMHYEQIELAEYPSNINQIKAKYNGKWGLLNKQNRVLIPFEYHKVSFFSNGIAKVWVNKEEYFYLTEDGVKLRSE